MATTIRDLPQDEAELLRDKLLRLDDKLEKKINKVMTTVGVNFSEALNYVVDDSPALWAKVYLNWEARDYQLPILFEGKRSKQLVLRLGRRLGKCLPSDVKIPDSSTGEYVTVEELFKKQSANIFSLDEDNLKVKPNKTNIIFENGIKPVYRIITKSGREIKATGNHPFYTMNGFVELDDLKAGDYIAIAKNMQHSSPIEMKESYIKFLAYMIGDGTTTNGGNLRYSCDASVTKILDEMKQICEENDCRFFKYDSDKVCDWHIKGKEKGSNLLSIFLKDNNLIGKNAFTKTIPDSIFALDNSQLKIFISRLYATDGWATSSIKDKKRVEIGYCSSSKELCIGLQSLLLRLGINSILQKKNVKYKDCINISYTLGIYSIKDCKKFIEEIDIFSKEEATSKLLDVINNININRCSYPKEIYNIIKEDLGNITKQHLRNYSGVRFDNKYKTLSENKIMKANELIHSSNIDKQLNSDIYWDEIKSIEYVEDCMTYDLTVPDHHNFVANDFITHNTDSMCVLILWYAYTQINKGDNGQYNILILTPYETQIDLIFTRLDQLIENSPLMLECIDRQIHHRKELTNGSIILGLTAGASSGNSGSNNSRGQRADVLIFDEIDYIGSSQITNALNIRNEAPERIKVIAASTPCGKHEEFYKWCVNSSKSYKPSQADIDNFRFTGYNITNSIDERNDKGNGWVEVYSPSVVNKELLKTNPDTEQTYLQDLKDEFSELRYAQEVMAEFGEEEMGVYQKKYLRAAMQEGFRVKHTYFNNMTPAEIKEYKLHHMNNIFMLGVDWDRVCAGTTLVGVMFDKEFINDEGLIEPKFRVILREEIPKSQFTFTEAVDRIIQLNDIYDFDWIALDKGYGDTQLEILHKFGMANPETGLTEKVIGYQFGEKLEVRDPYTMKKDKKPLKPFMVNNSVVTFEKGKMVFDPTDKQLMEQFEAYKIMRVSTTGVPIYSDTNEHIVDAVNLCLLIFQQKYGSLFKNIISSKIIPLKMPDRTKFEPVDRRANSMLTNAAERAIATTTIYNNHNPDFSSRNFTTGKKLFNTKSSTGIGSGGGFRRKSF